MRCPRCAYLGARLPSAYVVDGVRALDPETLGDVEPGEPGLLAFLDLGNVGSAAYVLTEDLGRLAENEPAVGRRFELLGRARDAQLRGCSLTTEQLLP